MGCFRAVSRVAKRVSESWYQVEMVTGKVVMRREGCRRVERRASFVFGGVTRCACPEGLLVVYWFLDLSSGSLPDE